MQAICFNRRLSVFICGQLCLGPFQQPARDVGLVPGKTRGPHRRRTRTRGMPRGPQDIPGERGGGGEGAGVGSRARTPSQIRLTRLVASAGTEKGEQVREERDAISGG